MFLIDQIIADLSSLSNDEILKTAVVLPSKRALLYFEQAYVKSKADEAFWLPELLTIDVFYESIAGVKKTEELLLITQLYSVYQIHWTDLSFADFYQFGQKIIQDFNTIDQHLLDAEEVYESFERWKAIDGFFEEEWSSFLSAIEKDSTIGRNVSKIWSKMLPIYKTFQEALDVKQWAYYGTIIKKCHQKIHQDQLANQLAYEHVFVGGLNTLSTGEKEVWEKLTMSGIAQTYWQSDKSFFEVQEIDAGRGLRLLKPYFKSEKDHWLEKSMFEETKEVKIYHASVYLNVFAHLEARIDSLLDGESLAIILADESVLNAFVSYFPQKKYNVSIGYSVVTSPIYTIFNTLLEYQKSVILEESKLTYKPQVLLELITLLEGYGASGLEGIKKVLFKKSNTLSIEDIPEGYQSVFMPSDDLIKYLIHQLTNFFYKLKELENTESYSVEKECAYQVVKQLHLLDNTMSQLSIELDTKVLKGLIVRFLKDVKVPFDTHNNEPVQVMGLLETRCLDFDNVVVLSFSEGYLPKPVQLNSYLPFTIRRYFGLPMPEERESVMAYHFFRLLQKPKRIELYTVAANIATDNYEISRYKNQLFYLNEQYGVNWKIEEYHLNDNSQPLQVTPREIVIAPSEDVKAKLKSVLKTFSASSLSTYKRCQLRFYFEKVDKLREEDEDVGAALDQKLFGTLVHDTLEYIYKPFEKKPLTKETVQELMDDEFIRETMQEAIANNEDLQLNLSLLKGKIKHQLEVSTELVKRTLQSDLEDMPDSVLGNEVEFKVPIRLNASHSIHIVGKIDRVDVQNDVIRILDYKTGKVNLINSAKLEDIEAYFDKLFVVNKLETYGYEFQVWIYLYAYWKLNGWKPMIGGLIGIKKGQNKHFVYGGAVINEDYLLKFEVRLKELLGSIFLENIDDEYEQTIEGGCSYCSFLLTCGREEPSRYM